MRISYIFFFFPFNIKESSRFFEIKKAIRNMGNTIQKLQQHGMIECPSHLYSNQKGLVQDDDVRLMWNKIWIEITRNGHLRIFRECLTTRRQIATILVWLLMCVFFSSTFGERGDFFLYFGSSSFFLEIFFDFSFCF